MQLERHLSTGAAQKNTFAFCTKRNKGFYPFIIKLTTKSDLFAVLTGVKHFQAEADIHHKQETLQTLSIHLLLLLAKCLATHDNVYPSASASLETVLSEDRRSHIWTLLREFLLAPWCLKLIQISLLSLTFHLVQAQSTTEFTAVANNNSQLMIRKIIKCSLQLAASWIALTEAKRAWGKLLFLTLTCKVRLNQLFKLAHTHPCHLGPCSKLQSCPVWFIST